MSVEPSENEVVQAVVTLPDGTEITANGPVVIVGPNGSGKTRRSRTLTASAAIEVVSALRSNRVSQQLPAMAVQQAKNELANQQKNAKAQPSELANDFDYMLSVLVGEASEISMEYLRSQRKDEQAPLPELAVLEQVQDVWANLFPGRELRFRDLAPLVVNTVAVGDEPVEYTAWGMSDGEKAALYLAARTLSAASGSALLVDEPETHFHSLLAVDFWDTMERARPDLRLIYVTHDMTFAASRSAASYLLANPVSGLKPIELAADSGDIAATLLGTASLSFYAKKIVFCEGEPDGLDVRLRSAWHNDKHTVVRAVGSCDMVLRTVSALQSSSIVQNLEVIGSIDRDYHSDDRLATLPTGVSALDVHEIEGLFALPDVVAAVATHLGVEGFDKIAYEQSIVSAYSDSDRHSVVIERWKYVAERSLATLISKSVGSPKSLDDLVGLIPATFDAANWDFSPADLLQSEKDRIEQIFSTGNVNVLDVLRYMPSKQLKPVATAPLQIKVAAYQTLVINAVRGDDGLEKLGAAIRAALKPYLG